MVLNYIWIAFFVIAFLFGLVELCFMGNTEVFTNMVQATFDSSKTAFETSLGLTGVLPPIYIFGTASPRNGRGRVLPSRQTANRRGFDIPRRPRGLRWR